METITKYHEKLGCNIVGFSGDSAQKACSSAPEQVHALAPEPQNLMSKFDIGNLFISKKIRENINTLNLEKENIQKLSGDIKQAFEMLATENSKIEGLQKKQSENINTLNLEKENIQKLSGDIKQAFEMLATENSKIEGLQKKQEELLMALKNVEIPVVTNISPALEIYNEEVQKANTEIIAGKNWGKRTLYFLLLLFMIGITFHSHIHIPHFAYRFYL